MSAWLLCPKQAQGKHASKVRRTPVLLRSQSVLLAKRKDLPAPLFPPPLARCFLVSGSQDGKEYLCLSECVHCGPQLHQGSHSSSTCAHVFLQGLPKESVPKHSIWSQAEDGSL